MQAPEPPCHQCLSGGIYVQYVFRVRYLCMVVLISMLFRVSIKCLCLSGGIYEYVFRVSVRY